MAFPSQLSPDWVKKISDAMTRPDGSVLLDMNYDQGIYDPALGRLSLIDITAGKTVFRLERESNLDINFIYATPSLGTRITTVNISSLKPCTSFRIIFVWSPQELRLTIANVGKSSCDSNGWKKADYSLMVDKKGRVIQFGDKGVQIFDVSFVENGEVMLENHSINAWDETLHAIDILKKGSSTEKSYEGTLCNQLISMLCTGFEIYCKRRFIELIGEGMKPDYRALEKCFLTTAEKNRGLMKIFSDEASTSGVSIADLLINRRKIDFGNYQNCKDAYSKGYGISFPTDLNIDERVVNSIVDFIKYRHRIIHVNPCNTFLNQLESPPKKPIFSCNATVDAAVKDFDLFIRGLHQATIKLRPTKKELIPDTP